MHLRISIILSLLLCLTAQAEDPIHILSAPQIDFSRTDGGLAKYPGAQTFTVWKPLAENPGWTYHHHPDIACWHGRLYVAWDSCEKDEDVWPSKELYSTSTDGEHWSAPAELFPQ